MNGSLGQRLVLGGKTLQFPTIIDSSVHNAQHARMAYTPVTHTRRTAHALGDKNESSALLCVHEFCLGNENS